ncbi:hypothetical protein BJV78DRAFT_699925 [Lactifluus subvellereus]|nr:hypothetical protein BJV78DRAFT_699925 [Lactifluus subvellereus]
MRLTFQGVGEEAEKAGGGTGKRGGEAEKPGVVERPLRPPRNPEHRSVSVQREPRGQHHRYPRNRHQPHRKQYPAPPFCTRDFRNSFGVSCTKVGVVGAAHKYATGPMSGLNTTKLVDAICQLLCCPVLNLLRGCSSQYLFLPLRRSTTCCKVSVSTAVVAADFVPTTSNPPPSPWCTPDA